MLHNVLGTVTWFNRTKGYGFIQPKPNQDFNDKVFVHFSEIKDRPHSNGLKWYRAGDNVRFDIVAGVKNFEATNVHLAQSQAKLAAQSLAG